MLYKSTPAREYLLGKERTTNPTPAGEFLLGRRTVRRFHKQYPERRSAHRGNPLPALVASLAGGPLRGVLGALFGKKPKPPDQRYADLQAAMKKDPATRAAWLGSMQGWAARGDPVSALVLKEQGVPLAGVPAAVAAGGAGPAWAAVFGPQLTSTVATTATKTLIQAATRRPARGRAARAPRMVNRYDPETGDKYRVASTSAEAAQWPSRRPSAAAIGGGALAAAPIAGKAVGLAGAGAGAIAGVVIGGLAVGLLIGTGLRKLFGTARAVRNQEAAVQGALVVRQTRAQLEAQLGRKLNAAETRALFDEYAQQLVRLGFTQDASGMWSRKRSALERLLG